ncbi:MAG: DUF362 domain-containing protein [Thermoleophilia bacterium]|nr:DUF362 domain-containing protein [Thermoleophilia bacterium]
MSAWPQVPLPDLVRVRQRFPSHPQIDVVASLARQLDAIDLAGRIAPGSRVALTAGSRGIRDLVPVLGTLAAHVRSAGGEPFVVPCMGSHGGATGEGQTEVLRALGVTEDAVGAPIVSSTGVTHAGESRFGAPVWVAEDLARADAVIVVNRVKPHTDFTGPIESGLVKMLVIGVGKQAGAAEAHRLAVRHGFPAVLKDHARITLARLPVVCGVALIEDQSEHTAEVHVLEADEIIAREPALLDRARALMPSLPFDALDCLIVDRIGKEISGNGMDSKIVGRLLPSDGPHSGAPRITRIVVRDLTPGSHGNAIGIGAADFTTTRLLAAMDDEATAVNCITSLSPEAARAPIAFARDADAVQAAYATSGAASPDEFSLAWVRDTLSLEELLVSSALVPQARADERLEILGEPFACPVRPDGTLSPEWGWAQHTDATGGR